MILAGKNEDKRSRTNITNVFFSHHAMLNIMILARPRRNSIYQQCTLNLNALKNQ